MCVWEAARRHTDIVAHITQVVVLCEHKIQHTLTLLVNIDEAVSRIVGHIRRSDADVWNVKQKVTVSAVLVLRK